MPEEKIHFGDFDTDDICVFCRKPVSFYTVFHIENVVGHFACFTKAVSAFLNRRKVCIDDLVENSHFNKTGQFIEVVAEHECEFYTDKKGK